MLFFVDLRLLTMVMRKADAVTVVRLMIMMSVKANRFRLLTASTACGPPCSHLTHFQTSPAKLLCIAISAASQGFKLCDHALFSEHPPDAPRLTPSESQFHSNSTPLTFMWGRRGVGLLIRATDIGTLLDRVYLFICTTTMHANTTRCHRV